MPVTALDITQWFAVSEQVARGGVDGGVGGLGGALDGRFGFGSKDAREVVQVAGSDDGRGMGGGEVFEQRDGALAGRV